MTRGLDEGTSRWEKVRVDVTAHKTLSKTRRGWVDSHWGVKVAGPESEGFEQGNPVIRTQRYQGSQSDPRGGSVPAQFKDGTPRVHHAWQRIEFDTPFDPPLERDLRRDGGQDPTGLTHVSGPRRDTDEGYQCKDKTGASGESLIKVVPGVEGGGVRRKEQKGRGEG